MEYAIVQFDSEAATRRTEVASASWLMGDVWCWWPPAEKEAKAATFVMKHKTPGQDWTILPVRVLHRDDDFIKAREVLIDMQYSSSASDAEALRDVRQRKRKSVKRKLNPESSDCPSPWSEDEPEPIPKRKGHTLPPAPTFEARVAHPGLATQETLYQPQAGFMTAQPQSDLAPKPSSSPDLLETPPYHTPSSFAAPSVVADLAVLSHLQFLTKDNISLRQELAEIKGFLQQIMQILQTLHVVSSSASVTAEDVDIPLPAQTSEDVLKLEERVSTEPAFKSALITRLCCGGRNIKEAVRNSLRELMSNSAGTGFNWRGYNNKLAFGSTDLTDVVYSAVRKNTFTSSTSRTEVGKCIAKWLRYCRQRTEQQGEQLSQKSEDA